MSKQNMATNSTHPSKENSRLFGAILLGVIITILWQLLPGLVHILGGAIPSSAVVVLNVELSLLISGALAGWIAHQRQVLAGFLAGIIGALLKIVDHLLNGNTSAVAYVVIVLNYTLVSLLGVFITVGVRRMQQKKAAQAPKISVGFKAWIKIASIIGGIVLIFAAFMVIRSIIPSFSSRHIPTLIPSATSVPTMIPTATITPRPTITPSPTPTSVPSSAILFFDNFQNGSADQWSPSVGTWVVKKDETGQYMYEGSGPDNYPQTWPAQNSSQNWTDYAFESKIKIVKGGVFVLVRANGSSFYNVFLQENGSIALAKWISGQSYTVVKDTNSSILDNDWHIVRIEIVGQKYSLYIDNKLVTIYTYPADSQIVSGSIGYYIGGGDIVQIKDVRVWSLEE